MAHRVTFIPGDGVGPELSEATRRVVEGTGVGFQWDFQEAVDVVICRENHEDLYAGVEFEQGSPEAKRLIDVIEELADKRIREDSGISMKPISVTGTRRIVKYAFEYARR